MSRPGPGDVIKVTAKPDDHVDVSTLKSNRQQALLDDCRKQALRFYDQEFTINNLIEILEEDGKYKDRIINRTVQDKMKKLVRQGDIVIVSQGRRGVPTMYINKEFADESETENT